MAGSRRTEAAETAVMSRRDAIIGALALAAGSLIAAKPEVALAGNGSNVVVGSQVYGSGPTMLSLTSDATAFGTPYGTATLNGPFAGSSLVYAVEGLTESGAAPSSAGVRGKGTLVGHYGVLAEHASTAGAALRVTGMASFSRSSTATVPKGHSSKTVIVTTGIGTGAMILVTLQASAGTGVYVRYAKRTSATAFQIVLNKAATTTTAKVAWFILN
jgi:hypothetical protein